MTSSVEVCSKWWRQDKAFACRHRVPSRFYGTNSGARALLETPALHGTIEMNLRIASELISKALAISVERPRAGSQSLEGTLLPSIKSLMDPDVMEDVSRLARFAATSARRYPVQAAIGAAGLVLLAAYLSRKHADD